MAGRGLRVAVVVLPGAGVAGVGDRGAPADRIVPPALRTRRAASGRRVALAVGGTGVALVLGRVAEAGAAGPGQLEPGRLLVVDAVMGVHHRAAIGVQAGQRVDDGDFHPAEDLLLIRPVTGVGGVVIGDDGDSTRDEVFVQERVPVVWVDRIGRVVQPAQAPRAGSGIRVQPAVVVPDGQVPVLQRRRVRVVGGDPGGDQLVPFLRQDLCRRGGVFRVVHCHLLLQGIAHRAGRHARGDLAEAVTAVRGLRADHVTTASAVVVSDKRITSQSFDGVPRRLLEVRLLSEDPFQHLPRDGLPAGPERRWQREIQARRVRRQGQVGETDRPGVAAAQQAPARQVRGPRRIGGRRLHRLKFNLVAGYRARRREAGGGAGWRGRVRRRDQRSVLQEQPRERGGGGRRRGRCP